MLHRLFTHRRRTSSAVLGPLMLGVCSIGWLWAAEPTPPPAPPAPPPTVPGNAALPTDPIAADQAEWQKVLAKAAASHGTLLIAAGHDESLAAKKMSPLGYQLWPLSRTRSAFLVPPEFRNKNMAWNLLWQRVAAYNHVGLRFAHGNMDAILYDLSDEAEVIALIADLQSPDAQIRADAAWEAGRFCDMRVMAALAHALEDPVVTVRAAARHSFVCLGSSSIALLDTPDAAAKMKAIVDDEDAVPSDVVSLGALPAEQAVAILGPLAKHQDKAVRMAVANALTRLRPRQPALALIDQLMHDPEADVRAELPMAVVGLSGLQSNDRLQQMADDPDLKVVRVAAQRTELLFASDEDAAKFFATYPDMKTDTMRAIFYLSLYDRQTWELENLKPLLSDPDFRVRATGVDLLSRVDPEQGRSYAEAALSDDRKEVRSRAAVTLGDYADSAALNDLAKLAADKSDEKRRLAAGGYAMVGGDVGVAGLKPLLTDASPNVRYAALLGLQFIGDPATAPALAAVTQDRNPEIAKAAVIAVAVLDRKLALKTIATMLKDPDAEMRLGALAGLKVAGGVATLDLLKTASKDNDRDVREAAAKHLAPCAGRLAIPTLTVLLADPAESVRTAAAGSLQILPGEGGHTALVDRIAKETSVAVLKPLVAAAMHHHEADLPTRNALIARLKTDTEALLKEAVVEQLQQYFPQDSAVRDAINQMRSGKANADDGF